MAKQYLHKFTVSGGFPFPIDMLRYDSCTPATEEDSHKIAETFSRNSVHEPGNVVIALHHVGEKSWHPTLGRWNSFLWAVRSVTLSWEVK